MTQTGFRSRVRPDDGVPHTSATEPATPASRGGTICLIVVLLVALGSRLLFVYGGPQVPIWADQARYHLCGRYQASLVSPTESVLNIASDYANTRGPGYPLFLGVLFRFVGDDVRVARYAQAVLGAILCGLVYGIARRVAERPVALLATLLVGVYPTLIVFPGRLLSENLAIPLLYLALLLLMHAVRNRGVILWLVAGAGAALAGLSRSTILPVLPFLVLGGFLAQRDVSFWRRTVLAGVYALVIGTAILGWKFHDPEPAAGDHLVGERGVQVIVNGFKQPTHPNVRGWFPDPDSGTAYGDAWWQDRPAEFVAASIVNLPFCHLWYPDTSWVGAYVVPHGVFAVAQRCLVIFAVGGFALALASGYRWLPLLLLCCPFAITWVKWIELRHALPAIPLVCMFAAFFVATIGTCVFRGQRAWKKVAVVLGGAALSATVWGLSRPLMLANLMPDTDPLTLGGLHDAVVLVLPFGWAAIVVWLTRSRLGWTRAILAGPGAAVLCAAFFAAHMRAGSDSRWHRWSIDLAITQVPIVQEIELPTALATDEVRSASLLVDLELSSTTPPLRIGMNDVWLSAAGSQADWRPLVLETASEHRQGVYQAVTGFVGRELASWPQWWQVPVETSAVANRKTITCMLAGDSGAPVSDRGGKLVLGGGFCSRDGDAIHMPTMRRSVYRWPVVKDWRFHEFCTLDSVRTRCYFSADGSEARRLDHVPAVPRALPRLLDSGWAQANIRLLIVFKDGRSRLY